MYKKFKKTILTVFFLIISTVCESSELSRSEALEIYNKQGRSLVAIVIGDPSHWKLPKKLIRNGFLAKNKTGLFYNSTRPTKKMLPFYIDTVSAEKLGRMSMGSYHIIIYGKIKETEVTGIQEISNNTKVVHFSSHVEANELGSIITEKKIITFAAKYELFDDGWRFKSLDPNITINENE